MNAETGDKEGRKGMESSKRGKEWNNWKEHGRFGDGWYCCLLAITLYQEFQYFILFVNLII